jgi:hypothetical protein
MLYASTRISEIGEPSKSEIIIRWILDNEIWDQKYQSTSDLKIYSFGIATSP